MWYLRIPAIFNIKERENMNTVFKKTIAVLSSAAMLPVFAIPAVYADGTAGAGGPIPLLSYSFDSENEEYTLQNNAELVDRDEKNGKAVKFDAALSQYVQLDANFSDIFADKTGDFTISIDVKPGAQTVWTRVFDFSAGTSGTDDFKNVFLSDYGWSSDAEPLAPKFDGAVGTQVIMNHAAKEADLLTVDAWNNIAIVKKDNVGYMYINGKLSAQTDNFTLDLSYLSDMTVNNLGKSAYASDAYFDGYIDNLMIYDTALPEDEIANNSDMVQIPTDEIMNITFDEEGTGSGSFAATAGGTVTENGSVSYADGKSGKALNIASKSADNYLSLPDGILSGSEAATYSFWLQPTSADVPNWPFMTTPEDSHTVNTEKYVGMLATTSAYTVERYNNTDSRLSSVVSNGLYDDWKYVTVVFDDNYTKIYVNGILAASDSVAVDVGALFTDDSMTWIGHANWGDGEGFQGMIDEFRIYGRVLSEDEIIALAGDAYTEEIAEQLKNTNKLVLTTNFNSADGSELFRFNNDTGSFTVNTSIENMKPAASLVTVSVTPYTADNTPVSDSAVTESYEIDMIKSQSFSATVTPTEDIEYYRVTVTDATDSAAPVTYDAGSIYRNDTVVFPDAVPDDTYGTTMAAHDPSIFKDPETGIYYAYNTDAYGGEYTDAEGETLTDTYPMDTFMSADLIHWERIDNNFRIPEKATQFFNDIFVPLGSTANTGVWAPDIFYAEEDTEHPYWLYYSLSTTGPYSYIRSAIGLVKGETPTGPWTDCGIVISSQEGYDTNAIDSNIYVDTNGDRFFVWGSFQRGIHQVKLTADGLAEGVDYTSSATIHSSSKDVGSRLFSTPGGVQGPEGPYMINNTDTGYRYMFVSYGWLGTNYNIRVARNSLDNTWASETSSNPHHKLVDQQGRSVGRTFSEQSDKTELWGYKMIGSYQLGDDITYYGNGHNSVFRDDDGSWYLVDHSREVPDGYAALHVHKMLWTDEGWPVVSPITYTGEKEQSIPETMLYGTWDLSSVGQTIFADGVTDVSNNNSTRNVDLPVLSSEIILQPDHTLGEELGTWSYDGDHTVTLTFETDGDPDSYEFYKSGDIMELYVLTGYDKDQQESAIVMTGTDQNYITQFAKKNNAVAESTSTIERIEMTPVTIEKSEGGNPIVGFNDDGSITYTGDPSVMVDGDTVYLYVGHDVSTNDSYSIPEYLCYSTTDLENWTYEGVAFSVNSTTVPWANSSNSAWAAQVVKHNDKYYLYYCTWASTADGYQCIGVAESDTPEGPFTNVSTTPLINGLTMTTDNSSSWNDIDPTVWIETDENGTEHIYLNWGNSVNYTCELNNDMISVKDLNGDGNITQGADIIKTEISELPDQYTEAPWFYRRKDADGNYTGPYYMFFAMSWREQWAYATTDDVMSGEWTYGGLITPPTATSNTSHAGIFDFNGKTYIIYHNGMLPNGSGFRRSACIDELKFNADGSVQPLTESSIGLFGTASIISQGDNMLYHDNFTNSLSDSSYPIRVSVKSGAGTDEAADSHWEIIQGYADRSEPSYVSIQSVNKPGLFLTVSGDNVVLTAVASTSQTDYNRATFKTVEAIDGSEGISFESVSRPGYFLSVSNGVLTLSKGNNDASACVFDIESVPRDTDPDENAEIVNATLTDTGVSVTTVGCADKQVIAASYSDGDILTNVTVLENGIADNTATPIELDHSDSKYVKVFIWDSIEGMKPVDSETLNVQ